VPTSNLRIAVNNTDLLLRQQRLRIRSAQLRASLAQYGQAIQTPLSFVDGAQSALQWLYKHPLYPYLALGALALLKPRRAFAWGRRLWGGWLTFQRVRQWLDNKS
jgi:hypothetical protein